MMPQIIQIIELHIRLAAKKPHLQTRISQRLGGGIFVRTPKQQHSSALATTHPSTVASTTFKEICVANELMNVSAHKSFKYVECTVVLGCVWGREEHIHQLLDHVLCHCVLRADTAPELGTKGEREKE